MRSNAEIAKDLGYHLEEIPPYPNDYHDKRIREVNPNYMHIATLDKIGAQVHHAWYTAKTLEDEGLYETVINHCVLCDKIPNWNATLIRLRVTLNKLPKHVKKEILNELA